MNLSKTAMTDDQLDLVTGGTVIPHVILAGESLDMIAKKYNVDKAQLAKWNNLDPNGMLRAGDKLNIYF